MKDINSLLPNSQSPDDITFEWEPDLQFTGLWPNDRKGVLAILTRHGKHVVSHHFMWIIGPGGYSLELQFGTTNDANAACEAARKEYNTIDR